MSCTAAETLCTYSEGGRLGRPKGSKNKRAMAMQEPEKIACSDAPAISGASIDSGIPAFMQPSRRRHCVSHKHDLSKGSILPLNTPNTYDPVHCDNFMQLEGISDSSFGDDWSSWIHSIDGDLDLDGGLQQGFDLQFYQTNQPPKIVPRDADDAWRVPFGSNRLEWILPGQRGPPGMAEYAQPLTQDTRLHQKTSESLSGPQCGCLQQLVRLVYHQEDHRYSHKSDLSIDGVLHGIRDAQGPWKTLMQCRPCNSNYDQEMLLLFAMSIRTLLCSVYALYAGHLNDAQDLQVTPSLSTSSTPGSSTTSTPSDPERQTGLDDRDVRVSVGSYQLNEEEKPRILGLMIHNALRSIAVALVYLCERTETSTGGSSSQQDAHGSGCSSPGRTTKGATIELLERLRQSPLELDYLKLDDVGSLIHNVRTTMEALKNVSNKSNQQY